MEKKQQETNNRVQITKAVFDGLEFIRRSGATNMLDRPVVLHLAREWDFTETADWIESVDTGTYGRLIFQGPEVIEDDLTDQDIENDPTNQANESDLASHAIEHELTIQAIDIERARWNQVILGLGKRASLTIADTYETEQMGVLFDPSRRVRITAERNALIRNLAEASNLELQLEEMMSEIQRGIESLQYMIDPENN
jgi:hypothetical protein